jgi:hypothetical protein
MTYKQREMNSLPVILNYFMQGGEKCLFFAITSLSIQLWIAQFQNGKTKLYTAEIHVSRKSSHGGHLEFPIVKWFTSLVQDHPMIIPAKSQFNWLSGF